MTGRRTLRAVVLVGLLGFLVGVAVALPFVKVTEARTTPSAAMTKAAAAHVPTGGSDDQVGPGQVDLYPTVAAGPNRPVGDGSGAKKSGALSAVAVVVLVVIVAGTAAFGSRRSSR